MTPENTGVGGIFFPPRIVWMDAKIADSHERLNDARDRYCAEGLVVLMTDDHVKDALKIIQHAAGFPRVCDPEWAEKQQKNLDGIFRIPIMVDPSMAPGEMKLKNMETGEEVAVHNVGIMGEKRLDMVNHPPHYTDGGIETIEYLRAKLTPAEFRGFCKGNALKYLSRAGKKGSETEDCEKAQWYLAQLTKTPPAKS